MYEDLIKAERRKSRNLAIVIVAIILLCVTTAFILEYGYL